jgi:hypothetical protein
MSFSFISANPHGVLEVLVLDFLKFFSERRRPAKAGLYKITK